MCIRHQGNKELPPTVRQARVTVSHGEVGGITHELGFAFTILARRSDRWAPVGRPLTTTTLCLYDSDIMSASSLNLTELPTEVIEQILLHLPGQDILKMEAVLRLTADSKQIVDFAMHDPGQPAPSGPRS